MKERPASTDVTADTGLEDNAGKRKDANLKNIENRKRFKSYMLLKRYHFI